MKTWTHALGIAAVTGALLLTGTGCTATGHGKASKPAWKVFETKHPLSAAPGSTRSGPVELRIDEATLVERSTVFESRGWELRLRASVLSAERLPLANLTQAFKVVGRSGTERGAQARPIGAGRATWQHQQHTGEPTYLPPNVSGVIEVVATVGDADSLDEPAALVFEDARIALSR